MIIFFVPFFPPSLVHRFKMMPLLQREKTVIIETQKNKVKTVTKADSIWFGERDKKVFKSLSYARKEFFL